MVDSVIDGPSGAGFDPTSVDFASILGTVAPQAQAASDTSALFGALNSAIQTDIDSMSPLSVLPPTGSTSPEAWESEYSPPAQAAISFLKKAAGGITTFGARDFDWGDDRISVGLAIVNKFGPLIDALASTESDPTKAGLDKLKALLPNPITGTIYFSFHVKKKQPNGTYVPVDPLPTVLTMRPPAEGQKTRFEIGQAIVPTVAGPALPKIGALGPLSGKPSYLLLANWRAGFSDELNNPTLNASVAAGFLIPNPLAQIGQVTLNSLFKWVARVATVGATVGGAAGGPVTQPLARRLIAALAGAGDTLTTGWAMYSGSLVAGANVYTEPTDFMKSKIQFNGLSMNLEQMKALLGEVAVRHPQLGPLLMPSLSNDIATRPIKLASPYFEDPGRPETEEDKLIMAIARTLMSREVATDSAPGAGLPPAQIQNAYFQTIKEIVAFERRITAKPVEGKDLGILLSSIENSFKRNGAGPAPYYRHWLWDTIVDSMVRTQPEIYRYYLSNNIIDSIQDRDSNISINSLVKKVQNNVFLSPGQKVEAFGNSFMTKIWRQTFIEIAATKLWKTYDNIDVINVRGPFSVASFSVAATIVREYMVKLGDSNFDGSGERPQTFLVFLEDIMNKPGGAGRRVYEELTLGRYMDRSVKEAVQKGRDPNIWFDAVMTYVNKQVPAEGAYNKDQFKKALNIINEINYIKKGPRFDAVVTIYNRLKNEESIAIAGNLSALSTLDDENSMVASESAIFDYIDELDEVLDGDLKSIEQRIAKDKEDEDRDREGRETIDRSINASLWAASLVYTDARLYDGKTGQAAIDGAEQVYEGFSPWVKETIKIDYEAYTSTRTDILKPAATDAQRLAFRDAYLLEYSTSNNQTKAYAAAKLAAESLDSPVVFKYPVSLLREDAAATARVRMAGLLPAFTGLGTPIFTLSGADAAKFEVVNGGLYLKAGVVVDSAVQSQLDVTISVTYPDAGTKPSTWEGAWPPVGSSNFSAQVTARMVDLPAINGTPAADTAPAGWWKGFGTPDIVAGNGVWPGESTVTVSDLSSPSPVGGNMALFLTTPDWNEGITTRLTGLVVGKTYSLPPMYWQQVSVMGDSSPFDGRSRFVVMVGGQTFTFEPNGGVGDDVWQTANVTFTATETTMLVSLKGSMKDGTPSVIVVDLDGPGNQAPTGVEFIDARGRISTSADMRSPSRVADIAISDDDEGQNTISLSGRDADLFEIRDNKLYLKAGVDLAALGRSGLNVTVDVQDTTVVGSAKVSNNLYIGLTTNKAPTAIALTSATSTFDEAPARTNRTLVAIATITDDRSGRNKDNPAYGTNVLTLSGTDADMFEVVTIFNDHGFVSHDLYLKAGVALDFEKKSAFNVTVTVTDPDFPAAALSTNFTLNVRDINEAPTDLKFSSVMPAITMASDLTVRTAVANLAVTDDALGTNTFVLTGTDAAFFEVSDGKLYLKAGMPLSATTKPNLTVIVGVRDRDLSEPAITKTLTIAVNNTNTAPTAVLLTPTVTRLDENTSTTTARELAVLDLTDDGVGTNTITLTGANAAFFEVVEDRLMLKAGVVLDFETTPTLTVTVNVDDTGRGTGVDASTTYTLQVTNINEAPTELTFANLVTVTSSPTPLAARLLVADIVLADDALGTNAFYLRGADADKFEIIGSKLYLKAGITLDYLTKPNFTLTIVARDATISGSSELREQFRIEVAPPGGFASVYGQFIYDQTGADNGYIQWPDGRKQYVSVTESQTTGQIILTDKLTNRRINYFSAPDGEFYVKPPTVAVASTAAASVSAASVTPLVNGGYAPDYGRLLEDPLNTGSFFIQWPDGSKRDVTVYVDSIDGKTTLYAKDDPTRKTRFAISMGMDGKSYVAPENTRQPFMMAAE